MGQNELQTGLSPWGKVTDHFTASLFIGRGQYLIEKRYTVLAAMEAAHGLEYDSRAHTRRALIYAIAPDGHATLLTAALIEKLLSLKSKVSA
ncbi:hypothetical protein MTX26_24815 [Bradyrhizobium sp. ISRA443]|uniref:hypothetical protein n=1 Tax=unclassified Bradyrhizobium TaxID=2631580 RepID=UPI00247A2017|nr:MULTISPECIES: hypothetical protein [unclassified Bradyrhizobium]WGR93096.1 hypothetical protein MTX20_35740 [Bradyrhizobium sp. ISRA435]WGR97603.1 hypothetical protein MTX23_24810 [Bradyrhizobium sp. ISRA436]WGS04493.1 hypothetical protein MTX18_24815 [Bradyrhizobium sp. ISRA437]WGS11374.1 hypothetical protein MTX26_24815 [Bradyrhizobium sp. ISRA443]